MQELKPSAANMSPFTPLGFLERAAAIYGRCVSVMYNKTNYTWSETHDRCLRIASDLSRIGIGRYDVVSVLAPNVPAMYELHFAVPMTGAILNTINTRLDAKTISILLQHSGSKLVFVDCLLKSLALEAIALFPSNQVKPKLILITDEYESEENNALTTPFCMRYEDMVCKGEPDFEMIWPESEWDPIVLNYTSGTTSAPKGVVLSHRSVLTLTMDLLVEWSVPKRPIYLWTLPMFHCNGWCFTWGVAAVGGTNICVRKFDAAAIYNLIEKHGVTHLCGAPVVLNMLSNSSQEVIKPLQKPVQVMTAGAPPPAAMLHHIESLGFFVTHGYGLTETGGPTVTCAWKPEWNRLSTEKKAKLKARQGVRTLLLTEVNVVNPVTGVAVPRDGATVGEVVLRGSSLMLGYYKDAESTARAMSNGWFFSGDVGVMHANGYLEIKDRSKDVIISGGENISSVEVESVLFTHPSVNEAAVVARPDEFWGETPCAFVSFKCGVRSCEPSDKELIEYCRERMPHYMVPKTVVFMEELPKTSTGKVKKYLLRELAKELSRKKN
ncbi:unnamed protein product [Rhodiola kirilowii]